GIMALVTSQGTMDKKNPKVRQYIANRAELLGAIRLPNNVFGGNAGAQGVVSDILFLQKRDRILDISPDWVHLGINDDGITLNRYFIDHPEMVLGNIKMVSGRFGETVTCEPFENQTIEELLDKAINNISGKITNYIAEADEEQSETLPADLNVKNYSYTVVDGKIYFRENAIMTLQEVNATAEKRIKGMIKIRDSVKHLIMLQTENYSDEEIKDEQANLNKLYDDYTKQYGLLNSRANSSAFSSDSSYPILSSLEVIDENGNFKCKSDMFYKRTIRPHITVTSVDTSAEALAVSLAEKAKVDIQYMQSLTGFPEAQILKDLRGVLFRNIKCSENQYEIPKATANLENFELVTADEYLSGNVRNKLKMAKAYAEVLEDETQKKEIKLNIQALQSAMPKELNASEISVRLGATWIPKEDVQNFVYEFLETPLYLQYSIKVNFSSFSGEWQIENKNADSTNIKATSVYGTKRINAYKIIEETLNLKDVRIFDYVEDNEGKTKAILNKKETAIASSKQEQIKEAFAEWIFKDPHRRERLCNLYNEKFNSVRPREYDGSHLTFPGINPEISLRPHQVNAIAHILYGGNTLLAHTVGAGKTFEMVSAAMESKRLGLCNKSLFVVPNHLTEQWGAEFLQLYPGANILVATKKDFETKNRKKFCARIATGEYDAVIIGHSQFEKIPLSVERQQHMIESQINEITMFLQDTGNNRNNRFTVKQLEKTKKSLNAKLEKLNSQERKDNVITFEELGVDRLFVDEAHYYKNLYLYTKMRNVGGIAQTEAQKSSDLFMKCQYLDEITNSRGTIFATGTPISNSMVELYTMQRYLQYNTLVENGLQNFDAWASTFGETVTATELNPEGTGYRSKTRFAKFYNLPELMSMFKEVADIQTADMLNLPVPEASFHNVAVKPSEIQKKMVEALAERAENVRNSKVEANVDNMLKITNDGRKLA
ncbi:MAG: DEAD/DEAH box helicase family protein, partial [Acutalibacteraceae bacterium]